MRGVISAPRNIITGAFNIRFAFQREVDLRRDDVVVMPIEGDPLGHAKDTFGGGGANYHLLCYIPDALKSSERTLRVPEKPVIDAIKPLLNVLLEDGIRLSPSLISDALQQAGETNETT